MPRAKEELWQLTSKDAAVTGANGTASTWSDNYRYQVPVGYTLIFKPGHTFSASLNNGTASPVASGTKLAGDYVDTDPVRISVRNSDESERKLILQRTTYKRTQEFQNRDKMCRLDISEPEECPAGYWVVVETYATTALSATDADSYFILSCDRIRHTLFD